MNCLAHIYLSGDNTEILWGNFIGDGVKGNQAGLYSPGVQAGIALHRFIDTYTDAHPLTAEARGLIRPHFRKYAGVVLDVYFDHYLGAKWLDFHHTELHHFVENTHQQLDEFEPHMPPKMQYFYKYMKQHNWLLNYRHHDALDRVFQGMARRTPFESNMEQAVPVLIENHEQLEQIFDDFFPELKNASETFRKSNIVLPA